ncbi:MAG: HAMP domain-containing sensor histidine kinase [Candidatus Nitrosopolaris sp.]
MSKQHSQCALCGKTIIDVQEQEPSILKEAIDGICYTFDTNECVLMFKRFRSVYGDQFEKFITPQEQFVSDHFWNIAIPTEQEIREIQIEREAALDKQDTAQVIHDPVKIQNIGYEIGRAAKDEILMIYSSASAFHRQEKLGAIQSLREIVDERGVKARILTPKGEVIDETIRKLRQYQKIEVRYIEPGSQTNVTIVVVDRKSSLVVELKDDEKESFYEAMGFGTYSNRMATVLSYVSIFESLWKQSELHEKLNELCEQLKIRDKIQTEFINIAAHELRNPIQPIMGLAEILRSKKDEIANSNMYYDYLSIIIRNARKLKDLTDNILDIARIESQSINLNKEIVNIDTVILNAVQDATKDQSDDTHGVRLLYHNITKKGDIADNEGIMVCVDKGRISQVISNLIDNAFNFTKKGAITITKEKRIDDGSVIVSVKDTGTGIDSQILPRLFTKFTTGSDKGTGLGLYICKTIIEAHGGKIWGENNEDHGATFSFSLPTGII